MLNEKCLKLWSLLLGSPPQPIHPSPAGCRSAGGQAVPEKWMMLHPLLFIATHGANLPVAADSSAPPLPLRSCGCPRGTLQEKLVQVFSDSWSSTAEDPEASDDFVPKLLKPLPLVLLSRTELCGYATQAPLHLMAVTSISSLSQGQHPRLCGQAVACAQPAGRWLGLSELAQVWSPALYPHSH